MLLQATPSPAAQGKHIRYKAAYIATQPASQTVTEGQTATFFCRGNRHDSTPLSMETKWRDHCRRDVLKLHDSSDHAFDQRDSVYIDRQ